jgi:hypothetical protein
MAGDGGRVPDASERRTEWPSVEMVRCRDVGDLLHGHRCGYAGTNELACPNHIPCPGETYMPLADPASVLAALLAESPEATVAAIEALLTSDEASIEAACAAYWGEPPWPNLSPEMGDPERERAYFRRAIAAYRSAACRSLLSMASKGDGDA